jgi:hypothetical protein
LLRDDPAKFERSVKAAIRGGHVCSLCTVACASFTTSCLPPTRSKVHISLGAWQIAIVPWAKSVPPRHIVMPTTTEILCTFNQIPAVALCCPDLQFLYSCLSLD